MDAVEADMKAYFQREKAQRFRRSQEQEKQHALQMLKQMSTYGLLKLKKDMHRFNRGTEKLRDEDGCNGYGNDAGPYVNWAMLKAELATRPHLPNKQERREARQRLGKERRNGKTSRKKVSR